MGSTSEIQSNKHPVGREAYARRSCKYLGISTPPHPTLPVAQKKKPPSKLSVVKKKVTPKKDRKNAARKLLETSLEGNGR